jgi:predicted Co/Zn/Cd cation transporter (cation efflux family)
MFETINESAVLVVSFLALAVGSIWYSPLLFGNAWQRLALLRDSDLTYSRREFSVLLSGVLVANIIVFGVIAHVLTVVPRSVLSLTELLAGLSLLVSAVLVSMAMWEKRSCVYGCIHVGYAVLVISMGIAVITYWPW